MKRTIMFTAAMLAAIPAFAFTGRADFDAQFQTLLPQAINANTACERGICVFSAVVPRQSGYYTLFTYTNAEKTEVLTKLICTSIDATHRNCVSRGEPSDGEAWNEEFNGVSWLVMMGTFSKAW
jgi:hypothetical protein